MPPDKPIQARDAATGKRRSSRYDSPVSDWQADTDGTKCRIKGSHLRLCKRSVVVDGRRTSISVPDNIWIAFKATAAERKLRLDTLICAVDVKRRGKSLSRAVRDFVLTEMALSLSPPIAADSFEDATLVYGDNEP